MKKILHSLFAVLFIAILPSCDEGDDSIKSMVGVYELKKEEYVKKKNSQVYDSGTEEYGPNEFVVELKSDGSFVMKENGAVEDEGTFEVENGKLIFNYDDDGQSPDDSPTPDHSGEEPRDETTGEDPTNEDPTHDEPTGEEPSNEDPNQNEPTGEEPTGEEPNDHPEEEPINHEEEEPGVYPEDRSQEIFDIIENTNSNLTLQRSESVQKTNYDETVNNYEFTFTYYLDKK